MDTTKLLGKGHKGDEENTTEDDDDKRFTYVEIMTRGIFFDKLNLSLYNFRIVLTICTF